MSQLGVDPSSPVFAPSPFTISVAGKRVQAPEGEHRDRPAQAVADEHSCEGKHSSLPQTDVGYPLINIDDGLSSSEFPWKTALWSASYHSKGVGHQPSAGKGGVIIA
jgi:hypothetical protein